MNGTRDRSKQAVLQITLCKQHFVCKVYGYHVQKPVAWSVDHQISSHFSVFAKILKDKAQIKCVPNRIVQLQ